MGAPPDDSRTPDDSRWSAFTPAEARRFRVLKAKYLAGHFIDDDPYVPGPRGDKRILE